MIMIILSYSDNIYILYIIRLLGMVHGKMNFFVMNVDTTSKLALYQDCNCNTLVTRIEIRIMRLRKDRGVRIKGALQATQDPNVQRT